MNTTENTPRKDPLVDAYRQASEHEGARPSAKVRAAVLAHARVVAQSAGANAAQKNAVNETIRATPAANESSPIWRLAAGVVVGLLGVWLYQLSQPSTRSDTTVASASAPAPAPASAPPGEKAKVSQPTPAAAASPTPPEAAVAVAAAAPPAPVAAARSAADPDALRARADSGGAALKRQEPVAEPAIAMATSAAQPAKKELSVAAADRAPASVAAPASVVAADSANNMFAAEAPQEAMIASAELRKSARAAVRDEPRVAAAPAPALAATAAIPAAPPAPNAFPAQVAGASTSMAAAAPPPAAAVTSGALSARGVSEKSDAAALRPQSAAKIGEIAADRPAQLSEVDQSLFNALRAGNMVALRAAIARGGNVNVKDERGRTPIQLARERNDVEAVRVLEASGAR